jgi:RNA 2',3'-cyclic 3'-phosphodiesterase
MAIRSFLAFELPPDIKRMVKDISEDIRRTRLDLKWVKVDNIHLTVVFMGNIRSEDVRAIGEEAGDVCVGFEPFEIALKGLGVFPNTRRPRVLWLGLEIETERISSFRDSLQERLLDFGVREEKRAFTPHLTLGRFRKPEMYDPLLGDIISRYADIKSPVGRLEELVMFKSELRPGGAEYTKLKSFPLKGIIG